MRHVNEEMTLKACVTLQLFSCQPNFDSTFFTAGFAVYWNCQHLFVSRFFVSTILSAVFFENPKSAVSKIKGDLKNRSTIM